jgi:hypothetical protein
MIHFKRQLAVLIFCAIGFAAGASGQVITTADAYTNTGASGTNYGANALLDVQSGSQVTYIQFNLGSIPAGYNGSNVAKATLKLFVNAVTTAGNFNVQYVNVPWSEGTITAKSSPAFWKHDCECGAAHFWECKRLCADRHNFGPPSMAEWDSGEQWDRAGWKQPIECQL